MQAKGSAAAKAASKAGNQTTAKPATSTAAAASNPRLVFLRERSPARMMRAGLFAI